MIDIQTELDILGVSSVVVQKEQPRQRLIESQTHILAGNKEWGWQELRDYVVSQIEQRWGLFPRDAIKEASIFRRFIKDWGGQQAEAIARQVFEVYGGSWEGQPVHVNRFCKGSDPFFAVPIVERLARL